MNVAICQVKLRFPENQSLKGKRQVLKSIIARLRNKFNVSVAEVDNGDKWQRATLGIVTVSNESRHVESMLVNVEKFISGNDRVEIIDSSIRYV